MNKQLPAWKMIVESIAAQVKVMLMYVVESVGSSPGRQGFFMVINATGQMEGSLGGGIMEHKFIELARARFADQDDTVSLHRQIHNKTAPRHQSGMICSGEQTILMYQVRLNDIPEIAAIVHCLENYRTGTLQLSPDGLRFITGETENATEYFYQNNTEWKYTQTIGFVDHLHIIGGGHCSLALSKIMSMLDFYIHLYDDRNNLNTMVQNDFVHEKQWVDDYTTMEEKIPRGKNRYVVIMTFGYRTDDEALSGLIDKDYKYLGLLGSKAKVEKMFSDYRNRNVDELLLQRMHAPVGLPIKSQTPAEIAISIAAEIIRVRNKR